MTAVSGVIDAVNERYGKHTLSLGSSLFLGRKPSTGRGTLPWRKRELLEGETFRQRLKLPRLGVSV